MDSLCPGKGHQICCKFFCGGKDQQNVERCFKDLTFCRSKAHFHRWAQKLQIPYPNSRPQSKAIRHQPYRKKQPHIKDPSEKTEPQDDMFFKKCCGIMCGVEDLFLDIRSRLPRDCATNPKSTNPQSTNPRITNQQITNPRITNQRIMP